MKLWQKEGTTNRNIEKFTIGEDQYMDLSLAPYDVIGSLAHARMLRDTNLIDRKEWEQIDKGLRNIFKKITEHDFSIGEGVEDIHSQVELLLTELTGEAGKKIHTGRSRNDQVLLDVRLYMRDQIIKTGLAGLSLSKLLLNLSEKNKEFFMPGYTHFQVAMPSSFGLWFGAYAEGLTEDIELLKAVYDLLNRNPLGSAAGYGSSFNINRQMTTDWLGFSSMNINSIAAQMGRGKSERFVSSVLAQIADSLGRMAGEICLYLGQDFNFFKFPDELTTGSSIMPHKKNPDVFELIRGKCNQIKSIPHEIMLITNNLPSGYHRDYQLMKERIVWSFSQLNQCLEMMNFMLQNVSVNQDLKSLDKYKYTYSVELVNEYVAKGTPFREAYKKVSELISSGNFEIPQHPGYTHEGSIGNLMNSKIEENVEMLNQFFLQKEEFIRNKFDELTG